MNQLRVEALLVVIVFPQVMSIGGFLIWQTNWDCVNNRGYPDNIGLFNHLYMFIISHWVWIRSGGFTSRTCAFTNMLCIMIYSYYWTIPSLLYDALGYMHTYTHICIMPLTWDAYDCCSLGITLLYMRHACLYLFCPNDVSTNGYSWSSICMNIVAFHCDTLWLGE